ncbi:MAG: mannitol-1-phosphate 5-dehydrogenase [Armatimonadota bacterium]
MKKAVQFGAGNIGRGFVGQLFFESGYETVFVDVVPEVVRLLNERNTYTIRIASAQPEDVPISNVRAVSGRDLDAVAQELATADIACTAVGVNVLPMIAPALALGVQRRAEQGNTVPLNIIICENLVGADTFLKDKVKVQLPAEYHRYLDENIGFVMSVVARMVPVMTEEQRKEDPLLVVVEAYKRLPVDRDAFVGPIPEIVGVEPKSGFGAYVDDKLFTHNCGHAVAAYLGYLRGHEYMYQVMADENVVEVARGAMLETAEALVKRYGFERDEQIVHIDDLLERFGNAALGDQVARVGRDPVRKLGPDDRLVGAAKFALSQGISPINVCKGISAGLRFNSPDDPSASKVQDIIRESGVAGALREVCGLDDSSPIFSAVVSQKE